MKILFEVNHPAHVHLFKNIIWELEKRGHKVLIVARDKEVTLALLDAYKLNYIVIGPHYKSMLKKAYGLIVTDYRLLKIAGNFKPDILVGRGSVYLAHLSFLINKPYIAYVDTENANLAALLTFPFADVIITSTCFKKKINPKKHIKIDGYKELAYLHPNYFTPDPSILHELGMKDDENIIVIRTVAWEASHDIGDKGFTNLRDVVNSLKPYGRILITSETELSPDLQAYKIKLPPEKIHNILFFASLYIGESATMATESAILGTTSIFVSTSTRGYTDELENKYGLVYTFSDEKRQEEALEKAIEILKNKKSKLNWGEKRARMLNDKIDVADFIINTILNYKINKI